MSESERFSRAFYEGLGAAGLAARTHPDWDAQIVESLVGLLPSQPARVLDVGCGYGRVAVPLAALGYDVDGIDLTPALVEAAAEHAAREGVALRLATGSMTSLPYADGEFDAVVCLWSAFWELLEEREQLSALAEMWRVLALGGLALVEGPLPEEEPGQIDWLVIEGLQNPHFVHDAPGLLRLSEAAGIRGGAVMERDWAGRTRLFLELRR